MPRNSYKARAVLNYIIAKVNELRAFSITNEEWDRALSNCIFLESAVSLKEFQSGSSYTSLSMNVKAFHSLLAKCKSVIDSNDPFISHIAQKLDDNLAKYDSAL